MKVCTDACLFGAWTAKIIIHKQLPCNLILDIGTGTGLLPLMLMQQSGNSQIDAVEIDTAAAKQAAANFAASLWQERLRVFNTPIQSFTSPGQYHFIITNPPFFQNDLASSDAQRNVALHSHQLSLEELLAAVQKHLTATGHFAILLPYHRTPSFELLAQKAGFYLHIKTKVQQTPVHPPFRSMLLFGKAQKAVESSTIIIKNKEGNYSEEFTALLQAYYLYL